MSSSTLFTPDLHPVIPVQPAQLPAGRWPTANGGPQRNEGVEEVFRIRPTNENINLADFESLAALLWSPRLVIDLDGIRLGEHDLARLVTSWTKEALRTGLPASQVNLTSLGEGLADVRQVEALLRVYEETVGLNSQGTTPAPVLCQTLFIGFPGVEKSLSDVASHCLRMANEVVLPSRDGSLMVIARPTLRNLQDAPLSIGGGTVEPAELFQQPPSRCGGEFTSSGPGGFIRCDSCGKMRLVDPLALVVSQKLGQFSCGMLEDTRCMQPDQWQSQYSPFAGADGVPPGAAERADTTANTKKTKGKREVSGAKLGLLTIMTDGETEEETSTTQAPSKQRARVSIPKKRGDATAGSAGGESENPVALVGTKQPGKHGRASEGKKRKRGSGISQEAGVEVVAAAPRPAPTTKAKNSGEAGWFRVRLQGGFFELAGLAELDQSQWRFAVCTSCRKWRRVHIDDLPTIEGKDTFICSDLYEGSCDRPDDWAEARRELLHSNPRGRFGAKPTSTRRGSLAGLKDDQGQAVAEGAAVGQGQPPPRLRYAAAEYEPPPPRKMRKTLNPVEVDEALARLSADDEGALTMLHIACGPLDDEEKACGVAIPEEVLSDEASIRTFLHALKNAKNLLRYIRFPTSPSSPFLQAFNQEHLDMLVDLPMRWRTITHIDFGALEQGKGRVNILRPLLGMLSKSGLTHINADLANATEKAMKALEEKTIKNRERYWKGFEEELEKFTQATKRYGRLIARSSSETSLSSVAQLRKDRTALTRSSSLSKVAPQQRPSHLAASPSYSFAAPRHGVGKFKVPYRLAHSRASYVETSHSIVCDTPGPGSYEKPVTVGVAASQTNKCGPQFSFGDSRLPRFLNDARRFSVLYHAQAYPCGEDTSAEGPGAGHYFGGDKHLPVQSKASPCYSLGDRRENYHMNCKGYWWRPTPGADAYRVEAKRDGLRFFKAGGTKFEVLVGREEGRQHAVALVNNTAAGADVGPGKYTHVTSLISASGGKTF
ncbi:hypothetical protein FOZ62_014951 [Perkinsus olseni]|uniref:CW-type domain-containing protein n=1 Tax=Perkinsus olseni TaxID=32597 RepID=A0A7J6PYN3_PEROL|nr:hypothetical protein FOZ62_014951 [Perkinsus olseni]